MTSVRCDQAEAATSAQASAQAKLCKAEEGAADAAQKLKVCSFPLTLPLCSLNAA